MEVHSVRVEVQQKAEVIIRANSGKAVIPLRREGFLGIATEIR